MKSLTSTSIAVLGLLLLLGAVRGDDPISSSDYDVYVAEKSTPFIAYGPPEVHENNTMVEPRQLDRLDVPRALCGVIVLKPDLLMTSLRCSPSVAAKATIYLLPHYQPGDGIVMKVNEAKMYAKKISSIDFKAQFSPEGKPEVYTNIALLQLTEALFKPLM